MNRVFSVNKLKRLVLFPAFFFCAVPGVAQQAPSAPWQQEVKYRISVTLNDSLHTLTGSLSLVYKNNSPTSLSSVFMHLWPNAYKNRSTALCKQLVEDQKMALYYANDSERGYIDSLNFRVNGAEAKWHYDAQHIDICEVVLEHALTPGDSIEISTPFFVKIPDARFSRLGHTRQAYFMTQWYPKPAVFDGEGWHPMPYLDQGEFYSEFGSFDVSITLPANYVLAATGDRINAQEELLFLNSKIDESKRAVSAYKKISGRITDTLALPSDKQVKTVRFVQRNVHDFAWFADKRFMVLKGNVQLESGHTVDTWVYFTPGNISLWKDAVDYVNRSVLFYSKHVGEYPYRHASAVDGTIMAGGGMEYPNITVIGNSATALDLDMVITHEVGHNWFYGMLGSNERDFPFLDEGLNSFYELMYMRENYPGTKVASLLGAENFPLLGLKKIPFWKYHALSYDLAQTRRSDQPLNLPAPAYTGGNYGSVIYSKTAVVMDYLLQLNGEKKLEKVMKDYFATYRFRHPTPKDFEAKLVQGDLLTKEAYHGLFETSGEIDYKISSVRKNKNVYTLRVKNQGDFPSSFILNGMKGDSAVQRMFIHGFAGEQSLTMTADVTGFRIDAEERMPEIDRQDNYMATSGLFKRRRGLKFQFISGFQQAGKRHVYFVPFLGGNYYNGVLAGVAFHNYSLLMKKFEWAFVPMFGFRSKSPAGVADAEYKFFPGGIFTQVAVGAGFRSFSFYDQSMTGDGGSFAHYYKAAPYMEFVMRAHPRASAVHIVKLTSHNMGADSTATKSWNPFQQLSTWQVNELRYRLDDGRNVLHPFDATAVLQQSGNVVKLGVTLNYKATLFDKFSLPLRFFAGSFLSGSPAEKSFFAFRSSGYNGFHDYTLSNYFLGRNEHSGPGFSQYAEEDGNLKVWTPLGQSTTWLLALNVKSPKLFRLPLRVFGDVVTCDPLFLTNDKVLWDAGINLTLISGIVDVYYSVIQSADITQALESNNVGYANRLRFTFNINKLVPKRIVREIGF